MWYVVYSNQYEAHVVPKITKLHPGENSVFDKCRTFSAAKATAIEAASIDMENIRNHMKYLRTLKKSDVE